MTDEAVCAYRLADDGRRYELTYAGPLAPGRAAAFERAFAAAPAGRACDGPRASELVILAIGGRRYGVSMSHDCAVVETDGAVRRLTPALAEPWVVDGIPYVVSGPTGGKGAMIDSFIRLPG